MLLLCKNRLVKKNQNSNLAKNTEAEKYLLEDGDNVSSAQLQLDLAKSFISVSKTDKSVELLIQIIEEGNKGVQD